MTQNWIRFRSPLMLVRPAFLFVVLRRIGLVIGILLLFALGMRLVGPYVISSTVVRSAIERTITLWTGYRTVIRGETDLAYWPSSRIVLEDVAIYADDSNEKEPLVEIPKLVAFFDLYSMLRGIPDFSDFRVTKPHINIGRDQNGALNWASKGRLARAIAFFDKTDADIAQFPADMDLHVGTIQIENGIINVTSLRGITFSLSNVTATIAWPQLTSPLSVSMNAALNLTPFNLDILAAQPLPLLAGRNEPMDVKIASDPVTLSFSGITNLLNDGFLAGHVTMAAPSLADAFLFAGLTSEKTGSLKDFKLDADVSSEGTTFRFNKLNFSVSSTNASGVLDIGFNPKSSPHVNGTLAFDKFSIDKAVEAFGPTASGAMDTRFLQKIRMDLRLSADEATYSGLSLQKLGAGIRIADGKASLDIGESAFLGGTMMGRFVIRDDSATGTGGGQLDLHAENINLGALASAVGLPGPYPEATGTVNLSAATDLPLPKTQLSDYHGSFELSAVNGTLKHFDETQFRSLAAAKKFFQLKDAETGDFPFTSMSLIADFADGIAEIQNAAIIGTDHQILIDGVVPYPGFSLALSGRLIKSEGSSSSDPDLNVFIGGTLASAVISPISVKIDNNK